MYPTKTFTRREVIKGSLAVAGGAALAPFLYACGGTQQAEGELALDPEQQVTIEFLLAYPDGPKILRDVVSRFRETNSNIAVNMRETEADYRVLAQEMQAAIAAGKPPAVSQVGYDVLRYAAGSLPHLNVEDAARRDPGGEGWLNDNFADSVLDLGRVDGVLHFMPHSISTPVLWYNRDVLNQAGLDSPPATWEEVREYARRLTEGSDLVGLSVPGGDFWVLQGVVESNGARVVTDSGNGVRCVVDSPEAIEAIRLLAEMVREEKTATYDAGLRGFENFASGRVAMFPGSSAGLSLIRGGASFEFGAAPFPTFGDKPRRVPAGGNALGIFAEDQAQQAAAWIFIQHLLSPEAISAWDKATGYVPPRQGIADDPRYLGPYYEENPAARTSLEQLPSVVPWFSFPGEDGLQADQALDDAVDRIFTGGRDVAETLDAAARRVNELIAE